MDAKTLSRISVSAFKSAIVISYELIGSFGHPTLASRHKRLRSRRGLEFRVVVLFVSDAATFVSLRCGVGRILEDRRSDRVNLSSRRGLRVRLIRKLQLLFRISRQRFSNGKSAH